MKTNPLFASRKLNTKGAEDAKKIEQMFSDLLNNISELIPCGREFSIVQTKLEEASMFAKKALSKCEYNTLPDKPKRYIVENYRSSIDGWKRSLNSTRSVSPQFSLTSYTFDTLEGAELEARLQAKHTGDRYRAVELKEEQ